MQSASLPPRAYKYRTAMGLMEYHLLPGAALGLRHSPHSSIDSNDQEIGQWLRNACGLDTGVLHHLKTNRACTLVQVRGRVFTHGVGRSPRYLQYMRSGLALAYPGHWSPSQGSATGFSRPMRRLSIVSGYVLANATHVRLRFCSCVSSRWISGARTCKPLNVCRAGASAWRPRDLCDKQSPHIVR
jgi:hypothetical protein